MIVKKLLSTYVFYVYVIEMARNIEKAKVKYQAICKTVS